MGELLDRGFQKEILEVLASGYPAAMPVLETFGRQSSNALNVNINYLSEHGLVALVSNRTRVGMPPSLVTAAITAAGLDFLADDGGLSAILGVVTVRFDEAQIRGLLLERIGSASGNETMKSELAEVVRQMPAEGLREMGSRAISYGIEKAPEGIEALRAFLGL